VYPDWYPDQRAIPALWARIAPRLRQRTRGLRCVNLGHASAARAPSAPPASALPSRLPQTGPRKFSSAPVSSPLPEPRERAYGPGCAATAKLYSDPARCDM